ncbi:hypothetical protein M422DRAFT_277117 [Sphaerobolus stellatus SS14]|uniref:Uncharacterized protein n=1 Tax=Sphaerobolus stellatus (strain SS14) TaxID=990650 RepID=A0A0C9T151_SPHS4|nr:hypothetical protein M422DRAFT_277117 [Sphaerobolus stellatus SS14]
MRLTSILLLPSVLLSAVLVNGQSPLHIFQPPNAEFVQLGSLLDIGISTPLMILRLRFPQMETFRFNFAHLLPVKVSVAMAQQFC